MSLRSLSFGCVVAFAGLAAMSSDAKDYGQWTPLFNGKDLDGWEGHKDLWSVQEGVIVAKNNASPSS